MRSPVPHQLDAPDHVVAHAVPVGEEDRRARQQYRAVHTQQQTEPLCMMSLMSLMRGTRDEQDTDHDERGIEHDERDIEHDERDTDHDESDSETYERDTDHESCCVTCWVSCSEEARGSLRWSLRSQVTSLSQRRRITVARQSLQTWGSQGHDHVTELADLVITRSCRL